MLRKDFLFRKKVRHSRQNYRLCRFFFIGDFHCANGVVDNLNALLPIVMCGRYYIAGEDSATELQEIIEQLNRRDAEVKTGEIYPADIVPVLATTNRW